MGDVLLGALVVLGAATLAGFISVLLVGIPDPSDPNAANDLLSEPAVLVTSVLTQQVAMIGWVLWVGARKGNGVIRDFGLRFRWVDIAIGLGAAISALVVGNVVITFLSNLANTDAVDNTGFIDASDQGLWIIPIVLMVVVGAPLSEELFFRGLVFRAAERRWSTGVSIALTTVAFSLVHVSTDVSAAENLLLLLGIAIYGFALTAVVAQFRRLGPAIIGHMAINGLVVTALLAT
ncbi:MAG: CPBP family intramembrane metalloprotease [Acidimicrobiia bacterium]|nr:CPBP family intramembrane metalloprotease [Acidimicrobiia bacterium]